jgi:hypothetical protein
MNNKTIKKEKKKEKWTKLLCHVANGNMEMIQSDGNGKVQNLRKYEEHAKSVLSCSPM